MVELIMRNTNFVVLAVNHNPSILTKDWILKNKIVDDNVVNFVHTPPFSNVETENFQIIVDSDRLQISLKSGRVTENNLKELPKIVERYVKQLPETPYKALGLNFIYEIGENSSKLKEIFCPDEKKFKKIFSEKYNVGGYVKFKIEGYMVTLKIIPESESKSIADFNFNKEVKSVKDLLKKANDYGKFLGKSKKVIERLFE
ncbi:MAG: hypothetical protein ACC630_07870 [Nitrospinota bacterium]